ncbi:helix-turn-helix domain-containing protein [Chryseobacterium viscerum]|uniref:HTH luxR-type domain-containing protein n=1 Tax=Chryseobacterium viscerum TaxID=1037377 RepID=A0A5N4BSH4_9FLAO|nr:hypothetical protein [Chryseobacterium viscerum]KAB1231389.1 hypothetical protein F8D52_06160 [Chryseobacterium viscerum]
MKVKYCKQNGKIRALLVFLFIICHTLIAAQTSIPEIDKRNDEAKALFDERKHDESLKLSKEILEEAKQIGYSKGVAAAAIRIAIVYGMKREPNNSLPYTLMAQQAANEIGDYSLKTKIDHVLGGNYAGLEMIDEAVKTFRRMVSDAKKIPDPEKSFLQENVAYHNLAATYQVGKKMPDSAYYYYTKVYNAFKDKPNIDPKVNEILLRASIYIDEINKKKKDSVPAYSTTIQKVLSRSNDSSAVYAYQSLANASFYQGKYEDARRYNEIYIKWAKKHKYLMGLNTAYDLRYRISEKLNDLAKSQKELKEYVLLKDTITDIDKKNIQTSLKNIIKTKDENIKSETHTKNTLFFWIALIIALFIGSLFFFKNFIKKKHKEKTIVISKKESEITVLQSKINTAFEEVAMLAKTNSPNFFIRFQEVYPEFTKKLQEISPGLRTSELTLCAYTFLGFNTKDIADYTFKSVNTVRNRKYNLRKKMNIPTEENMGMWFRKLMKEDAL